MLVTGVLEKQFVSRTKHRCPCVVILACIVSHHTAGCECHIIRQTCFDSSEEYTESWRVFFVTN